MPFAGVTVTTELSDVTALTAADLAGTDLVTCSALLDILTAEEVDALVRGLRRLEHARPVHAERGRRGHPRPGPAARRATSGSAFNEHQRRVHDGRRLLGPDAPAVAAAAFEKAGATVVTRPSPWRLGPEITPR